MINARIRKRWLAGNFPVGSIASPGPDLTFDVELLGDRPSALTGLLEGRVGFADVLKAAKRPMIVVGHGAIAREDGAAVLAAAWALAEAVGALTPEWHGFNVLHHAASRVAALDLGFVPRPGGRSVAGMMSGGVDVLWLLGADEIGPGRIGPDTFVIYQGHHGDAGAARADVILPGAAYTEKAGTYVNTEGRVQIAFKAVFPPGEAREDWRILRAFSEVVGHKLPYDDLPAIRRRLAEVNPVFARQGLPRFGATDLSGPSGDRAALGNAAFNGAIHDYYQTNVISRASPTMAECSRIYTQPVVQAAGVGGRGPLLPAHRVRPAVADSTGVPRHPGAAADGGGLPGLRRAQGAGRHAVAKGPQRGRPVRAAADLRRRDQDADQGNGDPVRRQPGAVPAGAVPDLRAGG